MIEDTLTNAEWALARRSTMAGRTRVEGVPPSNRGQDARDTMVGCAWHTIHRNVLAGDDDEFRKMPLKMQLQSQP